jgi:hypothetical protein
MALNARTSMESFLFVVKGKPEHPTESFVAMTDKAALYLLHGMKKHSSDIAKEFEAYVLGDVEGVCLKCTVCCLRWFTLLCRPHIKPQWTAS